MNPSVELEDNYTLGVHIISFDDTVNNTIQSDNLINGELSSTTTTHPSSVVINTKNITEGKLNFFNQTNIISNSFVKVSREAVSISTPSDVGSNHEKQMSIIERIISSITSISTTPSPDTVTKTTTLLSEPTRASAILKLATKKTTSPILTQQAQTMTTEKPTTIIERILTSLSAIQADTTTESSPKYTQVGSNLNSISTTTIKPSSTKRSVTKEQSISTLPAQVTSTLDPLTLLDQIKSDQTLQKRTIEKLLVLLNVVNGSPTTHKTVLVTPKVTTYIQTVQNVDENTTPASTASTTIKDMTNVSSQTESSRITETTTENIATTTPTPTTIPTPTIAPTTTTAPTTIVTPMTTTIVQSVPSIDPASSIETSTTVNPKNDVETFVPTTIPVVSTRIQDMLNMLSKLVKEMDRSTTTTTETAAISTMNPVVLAAKIGEISTEMMPTVTAGDVTTPMGDTNTTSEVDDLNAPIVNNTTTMASNSTTSIPISNENNSVTSTTNSLSTVTANPPTETTVVADSIMMANTGSTAVGMNTMIAEISTMQSNANGETTTTQTPITTTPKNFITVTTPIIATTIRYTTTPINTVTDDTNTPTTTTPDISIDTTLNPSTLPAVEKIDISPDKVSIYSANDIASTFNDDLFGTTVSILARNVATTIRNEMAAITTTTEAPTTKVIAISENIQTGNITSDTAGNGSMPVMADIDNSTIAAVTSMLEQMVNALAANSSTPEVSKIDNNMMADVVANNSSMPDVMKPENSTILPAVTAPEKIMNAPAGNSSMVVTMNGAITESGKITNADNNTMSASVTESENIMTMSAGDSSMAVLMNADNNTIPAASTEPEKMANADNTTMSANVTETMANATADAGTMQMANDTMSTESVMSETTTMSAPSNTTIKPIESNTIDTTKGDESNSKNNTTSAVMSTNNTETNSNVTTESRTGKLLEIVEDPIQNDIQSTPKPKDKDYFIFAILSNNTILRKKPSMFPTKETPFLIVGHYPNNTIIRKFLNGTLVPEEPVIQVSGFDTRDPIPPLPDITSNQVTQTQAEQADGDNNNLQTVFIVNN